MLKNTEKLENIVDRFVKSIDEDLMAFMGTDFSYFYATDKIEFTIIVAEKMNDWFLEFVNNTFGVDFNDCFIISLLHEVGHHFTLDEIEDNDFNYCMDVKATLTSETKEECFTYFNLEDEWQATAWAVNYYLTNKEKCDKFIIEFAEAAQEFIILNKIEV